MRSQIADEIIEQLDLKAHPEGGHYRQVYKSNSMVFQILISKDHLLRIFTAYLKEVK